MSLSNFIKSILNIQDNNISFPEEECCQVTQKGDYLLKVFKGFLKSDYCTCPHCSSKNIVKNVGIVKLNIFLFKITILNLSLLYKDIFVRIVKKLFHLPLILLVITLVYLIILSMLLRLSFKKYFSYIYC